MKFLVWLLGWIALFSALESSINFHDGWRTAWIAWIVVWCLYGIGLALAVLVRAAMKRGMGSLRVPGIPKKEGE